MNVTAVIFLVAGAFLVMKTDTDIVASQTTHQSAVSRSNDVEKVIATLQDKEIKKSSPKQLVEAINEARMIFAVNPRSDLDSDLFPAKLNWPELLPALIALLDWEQPKRNDDFDPAYGLPVYPAIAAIAAMRRPALLSLADVLEIEKADSLKYQNALQAIRFILDRDDVRTIKFLRTQASASTSAQRKERLLFAIDIVEKDKRKSQRRIDH